jgi:YVTN family beta-propeller protein
VDYRNKTIIASIVGVIIVLSIGAVIYLSPLQNLKTAQTSQSTSSEISTTPSASTTSFSSIALTSSTTSTSSSTNTSSVPPLVNPNFTIPIGEEAQAIAYDPVNDLLLVVATDLMKSPFATNLYVLNATANTPLYSVYLGPATTNIHSIIYDPANQEMYVSTTPPSPSSCCNTVVTAISLDTPYKILGSVNISMSMGGAPLMQFDPANNETYVGLQSANYVLTLNSANQVVANITVDFLAGLAYDPLLGEMYISGGNSGVYLVSANNSVSGFVNIGLPGLLQFDPANGYVYVSSLGGVTALNGTEKVWSSSAAYGGILSFNPQNGDLYASNFGSGTITVIDKSNQVVATIKLADASGGVYDAKTGLMIFSGTQLTIINSDNHVTGRGNVPNTLLQDPPFSTTMAYVPQNGCVYVLTPNDTVTSFC